MSFPRYAEYKDSGVEWLGEVPQGWTITPIKHIGFLKAGAGFPHEEQGISGEEIPFHKVNALALVDESGYLIPKENSISRLTALKLGAYIFPPHTIVFAKIGAALLLGRIRLLKEFSCIDNNMMGLIINHDDYLISFIRYAMALVKFDLIANLGTVPSLNEFQIGNFAIAIPSKQEQTQIAAFLDHETAKLDNLINEQKKLIELLKEKRQAVISHAVTKGLNPNAPMKDSGVEWLGKVPEGWRVKKLKYLGEAIIGLTYSPDDVVDEGEGVLVLRSSNIQNKKLAFDDNVYVCKGIPEKLRTQKNDILICSRNGSRALIGKNTLIHDDAVGLSFGAFMCVYRSKYNEYLSKVFNSSLFEYQSGTFLTATINQLTTGNLNGFEVPLPPKEERNAIVAFLDQETAKIDNLIQKAQKAIQLLQERRTALISAAVTGKIDVRGFLKTVAEQVNA